MRSPFSIISCVDRYDCDLLHSYQFQKGFFFPHAVERDLFDSVKEEPQRKLDVLFLGTCYDPDGLRAYWKKNFSKKICKCLEEAVELVFIKPKNNLLARLIAGVDGLWN